MTSQTLPVPEVPEMADPRWLSEVLRADGVLGDGRVTDVRFAPVGIGLIGDSYRFELDYDGAPATAPKSLVGKFARREPDGQLHQSNGYLRETGFYRDVVGDADIPVAKSYFAEIVPPAGPFAILLEDFGPARSVDQLAGCSPEDAETAMLEIAAVHARFWGDMTLERHDWLMPSYASLDVLPATVAGFKERYASRIDPAWIGVLDRFAAAGRTMMDGAIAPVTLQHGDYRLDNVLYDVQDGARPLGILDWQTANLGPPLVDVSFFLCTGLSPELRRQHERELVGRYHGELVRLGVSSFSLEDCWTDYRRFALRTIQVGVQAPMHAKPTERGDAVFLMMLRNGCAMALDHGSLDLCGA